MKRFRTRRHRIPAGAKGWAFGIVLGLAALISVWTGDPTLFLVTAGISVVIWTILRIWAHSAQTFYAVGPEGIHLHRAGEVLELQLDEVLDASLVDAIGARGYIRQWIMDTTYTLPVRRAEREALRFCTVDVARSTTAGAPAEPSSRPNRDLVLLRLRDRIPLLLSPMHGRDLVDAIAALLSEHDSPMIGGRTGS